MNNELISVIVPVYKVEDYLEDCLNSIINQTYTNLEIILIDDGSPDRCGEICDEYAKQDTRIKVIHKKNEGVSVARNYGIESSTGSYITFVDSDDYIHVEFIEVLYKTIKQYKSDIACVAVKKVSSYNEFYLKNKIEDISEVLSKEEAYRDLFYENKLYNYMWNKIFRSDFIKQYRLPENKRLMEDMGLMYILIDNSNCVAYNSAEVYFYRFRENSAVNNPCKQAIIDKLNLLYERYKYTKIKHSTFKENYTIMVKNILDHYVYIYEDNEWKHIARSIMNERERIYGLNCKYKLKLISYKINDYFFYKIMKFIKGN